MALMPMSLRLEAPDGSGGEEYRIRDSDIEVRRVRRSVADEQQQPHEHGWQPLTTEQLSEHVRDNTVVAQWLRHRIGWRRPRLDCTDHETLQRFAVHENVSD